MYCAHALKKGLPLLDTLFEEEDLFIVSCDIPETTAGQRLS